MAPLGFLKVIVDLNHSLNHEVLDFNPVTIDRIIYTPQTKIAHLISMDTCLGMLVVRMEGSEVYAEETHIEQVHFPLQKRRYQYKCVYWVYFWHQIDAIVKFFDRRIET